MARANRRSVLQQVRQIYEERPYPGRELRNADWNLAPVEWMQALWRPERGAAGPARILIAGCGTGDEAFSARRRFPAADIVAVDFSAASIALARESERRRRSRRPIRFVAADLTSGRLAQKVGRDFDLILCHGVLTYVPAPAMALRNLTRCLAHDGALYLGVNGSRHRSVALRAALPLLGFDVTRLEDCPDVRKTLRFCDTILPRGGSSARETATYLASDLFGPLLQNLRLARWIEVAREAGLHFRGSLSAPRDLRGAIERGLCELLVPRTRADVSRLLDILRPAAFHRLLFTARPPADPPWTRLDHLLRWKPVLTTLYRADLTTASARAVATFRSPALNMRVSDEMSATQMQLLRRASGARSLGQILARVRGDLLLDDAVQQLYVLHQLLIVNLLPPPRRSSERA